MAAHGRQNVLGAEGDEEALLAQQAAQGVEPGRPLPHPARAKAVQRGQQLLLGRLDGHGPDLPVPIGLHQSHGVGAVGLVAPHVGADQMRGEKNDGVAELAARACPVVGGAAGFQDEDRRRQLGHGGQELLPAQAAVSVESARAAGDSQLQDGLCDVDPNESIVHVDSSFLAVTGSDSGTSMPLKSQEESIPSLQRTLQRTKHGQDGASPLISVLGGPKEIASAGNTGVKR